MDVDLFSNTVGYIGKTVYSSKYMTKTRNFRCSWPHNNVFARSINEEQLLKSIFQQPVGIDRSFAYKNDCSDLKITLRKFLEKHRRTNYHEILRKCLQKNINRKDERPLPRHIIKEYIHKLIHDIIPLSFFGNLKERAVFERNVRKILFFGKSQVFTLIMLMSHVRNKNKSYLKSISSNIDRTNLLAKLYLWLLKCFIFSAIKCVFYVTESNYTNKYLFYEKSTWQKIHEKGFNQLKKSVIGLYTQCIIQRKAAKENLYVLRILPKRRGSRPLYVKWTKKRVMKRKMVPPTRIVTELLHTIADERFYIIQNSSPAALHNKWMSLYFNWLCMAKPSVYFVRVDFTDAFGSINQIKLIESINTAICKSGNLQEIKFVYQYRERRVSVPVAFQIIKNYVTNFSFKHNKCIYRLERGIPQGGPLSSVLCNYYFGEVDLNYLSEFANDDFGFLVRNCDDYLYVTLDREKANKFLYLLEKGFPELNLKLNCNKTQTNLRNENLEEVNFNSFKFDIKSFQVYRCYKSYESSNIFHSSSFNNIQNPGKLVAKRAVFLCSMKLEALFLDPCFNHSSTILRNIYETSFLNAVRFVSFIDVFFNHYNQSFITRCIRVCSLQIVHSASKKLNTNEFRNSGLLQYVVYDAFIRKIINVKHPGRFNIVISQLRKLQSNLYSKFTVSDQNIIRQFWNIQDTVALDFIQ